MIPHLNGLCLFIFTCHPLAAVPLFVSVYTISTAPVPLANALLAAVVV
jgi:hypothetical protein